MLWICRVYTIFFTNFPKSYFISHRVSSVVRNSFLIQNSDSVAFLTCHLKKITPLPSKEKNNLIACYEKLNVSKIAFFEHLNFPSASLNNILPKKNSLSEVLPKIKERMRKSKFEEIEKVFVRWLKHAISQNLPICGVIPRKKKSWKLDENIYLKG